MRGIVGPAFAHLDVQEQVDGPLKHLGELTPGTRADLLDARAALAEKDCTLAVALDMDRLLDAHAAIGAVFPLLRLDGGLVGQFLMKLQKDLLARDLGRQQAKRQVGSLFLGLEERPGRQRSAQCGQHVGHPVVLECAHHEGAFEGQQGVEL